MAIYSYAIAPTHNVALGSLTNVENISAIGRPPKSQPVQKFPVRKVTYGGKTRGSGRVDHVWTFDSVTPEALDYIVDTYLTSSGTVLASAPVTIYTRQQNAGTAVYGRFNAYITYPESGGDDESGGDYEYYFRRIRNLKVRFTHLVEI